MRLRAALDKIPSGNLTGAEAIEAARKVHFRLRLDLLGSYGSVKDADVTLKRQARK